MGINPTMETVLVDRLQKTVQQLETGSTVDHNAAWLLYHEAVKELERLRKGGTQWGPPKRNLKMFDAINPYAHELQRLLRLQRRKDK